MRGLDQQGERTLGGSWSVLTKQKRDHQRLDVLIEDLLEAERSGTSEDREAALTTLCRLVFPHAFAEESVLWPTARRVLEDGDDLTLAVEEEHQEVNELVTYLERRDLRDVQREPLADRLAEVLREDVRDEEDELLPRLQQAVSAARLRALGLAWEAVRRVAPTRPHPRVSRRPPGNALAALPLTVVDRGRDRLESLARRRHGAAAQRLRRASEALARVADRAEQVHAFRRGEHPHTSR